MHFLTVVQNKGVLFQLKMNQVERKEKLLLFVEKYKSENLVRTSFAGHLNLFSVSIRKTIPFYNIYTALEVKMFLCLSICMLHLLQLY